MARLPVPGGDSGDWGLILNEYLELEHNADGTHLDATTTQKGVVELATSQEVNQGASTSLAVTPATLYTTQTLADGATINWDLSLGAMATVTLGGNRALANPTNLVAGASYILIVKQDGSGTRTLSFGSTYKFPEGIDPTLSTGANAVDIIAFLSDGTSLYGSLQANFS
jgi:hypothetical protein